MPHETRRDIARNQLAASLRSALEFERSPLRRQALVLPLRGRRRSCWQGVHARDSSIMRPRPLALRARGRATPVAFGDGEGRDDFDGRENPRPSAAPWAAGGTSLRPRSGRRVVVAPAKSLARERWASPKAELSTSTKASRRSGDRSVLLERASREAVASAHPAPERPRWNRGRSTKASKRAHARRSRASARLASAQTCFRMRHAQRA